MRTRALASCGRVLQGEPATRPARSSLVTAAPNAPVPGSPYAPYAGGGTAAYVAPPQPAGAYPAGPALVEASFLTLRGTVTGWEKASITILDRNGRSRTVALARGVRLWDGLQKGDLVSLRVPLDGSGALGPAERVERPSAAAASAAMPSKFSQNAPASR